MFCRLVLHLHQQGVCGIFQHPISSSPNMAMKSLYAIFEKDSIVLYLLKLQSTQRFWTLVLFVLRFSLVHTRFRFFLESKIVRFRRRYLLHWPENRARRTFLLLNAFLLTLQTVLTVCTMSSRRSVASNSTETRSTEDRSSVEACVNASKTPQ